MLRKPVVQASPFAFGHHVEVDDWRGFELEYEMDGGRAHNPPPLLTSDAVKLEVAGAL